MRCSYATLRHVNWTSFIIIIIIIISLDTISMTLDDLNFSENFA